MTNVLFLCISNSDIHKHTDLELIENQSTFVNSPCVFAGTTKIKNLDDNIGSLGVKLTGADMKEISDTISINAVAGKNAPDAFFRCSWKFANTPPAKDGKIPSYMFG